MNNPKPTRSRQAYLDHIRVFLTALVIMHHAAITFGADGGWYCKEVETSSLSSLVKTAYMFLTTTDQAYFMGFFFLIAGYFTPSSLVRKGAGQFIKDRFIRLGIPLVLFACILSPITIGFSQLIKGESFFGGFYWTYAMVHYECGPLWFVQALLIFALLYVVWKKFVFRDDSKGEIAPLPGHGVLLAAAIGTGFLAFAIRQKINVGQNVFHMQLGYFATYIVLFYAGCRASRDRWLDRVELRNALPWVIVTIAAIVLLPVASSRCPDGSLFIGGMNIFSFFYAMWEPFVAWGIILGMLYVARKYLSGTNPLLQHLARCSFAVYVVHAPVLVGMTLLFHTWTAAPLIKWLVVGSSSCVVAWIVASLIVRTPGLRKVF